MPSSGYAAWSVIAGEQPTAAKWNILGTNDASFNTGNGFNDNIIVTRHIADSQVTGAKIASYRGKRQNDTTNTDETAAIIQYGWGAVVMGGSGAIADETVTFPQAYTSRPIVLISAGGDQTSGAVALGNGGSTVHGFVTSKVHTVTTTTFRAYCFTTAGSWAAGNIIYYHWLAIGV